MSLSSGTWTPPRLRAGVLNLAGRWAFKIGSRTSRVGLALCGFAGTLDAMADNANYWRWHR